MRVIPGTLYSHSRGQFIAMLVLKAYLSDEDAQTGLVENIIETNDGKLKVNAPAKRSANSSLLILMVHVAANEERYHFFVKRQLAQMKARSFCTR